MTWNDMTVEQYQKIHRIITDDKLTDFEKQIDVIGIAAGISNEEMDAMSYEDFGTLCKQYEFLYSGQIEGNAVSFIIANNKRYNIVHDLRSVPLARVVEIRHYTKDDFIKNLHLIMASISRPTYEEFNVKNHEKYAKDMLSAKFVDVYNTSVFFYQLLTNVIQNIPDFLEQAMNENKTDSKTRKEIQDLCESLVGYTMSNK
jgi:hypothetical protein